MPSDAVVRARIDAKTKKKAVQVLDKMGLTVSDAIRLMLIRTATEKALPFAVRVPNAATRAARDEIAAGEGRSFSGVEDLFDDLNAKD